MTPAQRDAEIIETIQNQETGVNGASAQPHSGQAPINNQFVQLEDIDGDSVVFENYTDKELNVRRGLTGTVFYVIPSGTGRQIDISENANELYVKNNTDETVATFTYQVIGERP